jgi:hypothetical protein
VKGCSSVKGVIKLNQSKLNFIGSTLPDLLAWERERSSTFVPGTVLVPKRPGRFALALTRCMREGIDLVYRHDSDGPYWIGNRAQFIGRPIMPNGSVDRIRRYHDAVAGLSSYFLQQNDNKPADAARHMLNFASGFCVVRKKKMLGSNEEIWCGDCPDCMKNLGFECPVATKVRAKMGFFGNYVLNDLMLTQEEPSERASGPQDAKNLRGLGTAKKFRRQKKPGNWSDDPKKFWRSYQERSDNQFTRICSFFGLEEWEKNKKGALVKKRFSNSNLLEKLILFERCPTCSRGKSHDWPCQIKVCGGLSVDVSTQGPSKKMKLEK